MGICGNNSSSISNNNFRKNQISFRCFYDIKNIDEEINILNKNKFEEIDKEIKSKIKILNGSKKEELIFKKKFNKIGINTIDFIIEGKLINMNSMFYNCISLIKIEFISIDTSKVKNMNFMFLECKSLEYIDFSNFDTSNVEKMNGMFQHCSKLKEIKGINNINTSKVKSMNGMFEGCKSLEYLDLSNFDTSNVEEMKWMFSGCSKLKEIKGINNFNTSQVNDMCGLFSECKSLEYLDLSNFDTSNVEYITQMFSYCSKLKEIKGINNFNIKTNIDTWGMFIGCDELDYLTISDNKISVDIHKLISKRLKKENSISIMFFIPDKNIHYPIPCNEFDTFSKIEIKLFEEFPELKSKNIYYVVNGNTVNYASTLKDNKIRNGDTILINFADDDTN